MEDNYEELRTALRIGNDLQVRVEGGESGWYGSIIAVDQTGAEREVVGRGKVPLVSEGAARHLCQEAIKNARRGL